MKHNNGVLKIEKLIEVSLRCSRALERNNILGEPSSPVISQVTIQI